jgi:hypothetical protein
MSWFNRKKEMNSEEVPRLPELPENDLDFLPEKSSMPMLSADLPNLEIKPISNNLPHLPESKLPSSNLHEIKNTLADEKIMQKSIFSPPETPTKRMENYPSRIIEVQESYSKPQIKETEPIFIRLDKFQSTTMAFQEIKRKVEEIESLLIKTKEIKEKEQRELEEWEREIHGIKARIDSIDKNLFNKI